MACNENQTRILVSGVISITGGHFECPLEFCCARFVKVANAWFENYRPRQAFWLCCTRNGPLTPFSRPLMESDLLHYWISVPKDSRKRYNAGPSPPHLQLAIRQRVTGLDNFNWAASWQNQQMSCAHSEDSDQPGYPSSLIRVFAVRSVGS